MEFEDSLRADEDREEWKGIVATSTVVPRRLPRLRDSDEMSLIWKQKTYLEQMDSSNTGVSYELHIL